MRELQTGLWHWEAPHPDWSGPENEALSRRLADTPETPSRAGVVSSYAIQNGDRVLLFDPLAVPKEILELAANGRPAIVLTSPWHERDARSLVARLGARLFAGLLAHGAAQHLHEPCQIECAGRPRFGHFGCRPCRRARRCE